MKLRKLFLKDAKNLKSLFLNEESLKETGVNVEHKEITLEYMRNWIKEYKKMYSLESPLFILYAIINNKNEIIGTIGIGNIDHNKKIGKIGYWISNRNCGKGFATLAIKLFLEKISREVGNFKLIAEVSGENIASHRVLEKNGFKLKRKSKSDFIFEKALSQFVF
ncbi:MAG: GNAT family N-acetyltransferase [Nanoarchaeota archaeon]|jgi:RimJ/RimL family protein N-acetyltransferase|nr:GNAT family N-acetyltransferase [Nanoarchaeota archaeon]